MERYYVKRPTGKVFGPFDQNAIRLMLKSNKLGADAQVSTDKETWKPISQVEAFADSASGNKTQAGFAGQGLPRSAQKGPSLPRSKSSGPSLPRVKGGPSLPASKGSGPSLPRPKSSGPSLPKPKSSTADLPQSKLATADLPQAKSGPSLPRSKSAPELPQAKSASDLPQAKSALDLPQAKSAPDLPRSSNDNLPGRSGELPTRAGGAPAPAAPPEDDDLFGAPIQDDGDLFDAPELDEESDLFDAPGLDDDSEDLFGSPDLDEESDDLFDAPGFDDVALDEEDPLEEDDDLFDAPEMDDDDLFSDAPADDDDFLGGDQGFSFLDDDPVDAGGDDALEDWEQEIAGPDSFDPGDLGGADDDWGDDLLDDSEPTGGGAPPPSRPRQPASQPPASDGHDPFRPASTGIREQAQASPDQASAAQDSAAGDDKKRGLMTLVGVPVLALLLVGGAGFAIFNFLQDGEQQEQVVERGPRAVELSLDELRTDNFNTLVGLIDEGRSGDLDQRNQGRLLLAKSLFLMRYEDDSIADSADQLAATLAGGEDQADVAVGLAAHEARMIEPDSARAIAEPFTDDPELAYFAHLVLGIADARAHLEGRQFEQVLEAAEEDTELSGADEEAAEEDDAGDEGEELAAQDEEATHEEEALAGAEAEEEALQEEVDEEADQEFFVSRASEHFHAAAAADETAGAPHFWLARLALHVDDAPAALEHLERGIHADPRHVASRLQAGQLYYGRGDLNDAAEHLEKIIEELAAQASDDERGHSLHLMGLVHQARQESEQAINLFTRALSTDSSRTETLRALAEEYERAERYDEALTFFTTDENLGQEDPEVMLGIVRSHMGLEQWQSAITKLEQGEEQFPEDARFPYNLGRLNWQRGTVHEAREAFERAIEIDPGLFHARTSLARLAYQLDNSIAVGEEQVGAILESPDLITARVATDIARYYYEAGHDELALEWNEEALRLDPNYWEARMSLARLYLDNEQSTRALELLERARDEGVQDLQLSAYLADAYRLDGQFDRAIDEINNVIAEEHNNHEYIFIRGRIHYDRGNYATAREDFTNAYDLDRNFHEAYFFVGRTALAERDFSTAARIFRHVLDYQPNNGIVHYYMGRTFEQENSTTQALQAYRDAIQQDPDFVQDNPDVLIRRGRLLAGLGRTGSAMADVRRALEIDPNNTAALLAMGSLNFQAGNYDQAIEQYTQALEDDPEHPRAQYELGMSYIYRDQDARGARHLQLAVRHGYEDPEIYRTMGYLYRELGQRSEAVNSFKTYLRESDQDQLADSTRREMLRQIQDLGG